MKKKTQIALGIFIIFFFLREINVITLNHCYTVSKTNFNSNSRTVSFNPIDLTNLKVSINPSPFDYIPFYKSKTIEGIIQIGKKTKNITDPYLEIEYKIKVVTKGLCSGYSFRDKITSILKEYIHSQALTKSN